LGDLPRIWSSTVQNRFVRSHRALRPKCGPWGSIIVPNLVGGGLATFEIWGFEFPKMAIFACFLPGHELRRLTAQKWQTRLSLYQCSNGGPLRPTQTVAFDPDRLYNFGHSRVRIWVKKMTLTVLQVVVFFRADGERKSPTFLYHFVQLERLY